MKGDTRAELLLRYGAAFVAAIFTAAGMGCMVGWSSPALEYLESSESHLNMTKRETSWITPLLPVGQTIGYIMVPFAHKIMNEKWTLLSFSIPQIVSWFFIIMSKNSLFIYVARVLGGLGYAGGLCSLTMYLTEISSQHNRGIFLAFVQLFQSVGFFFMILFDLYFHYYYMNIIIIGTMCCFVFVFIFMPDSSYFKKEDEGGEEMVVLNESTNWTGEIEDLKVSSITNLKKSARNSRRIEDIECGEGIEVIKASEDIEASEDITENEGIEAKNEDIVKKENVKRKNGTKKEENEVSKSEEWEANEAKGKVNSQREGIKRSKSLQPKKDLKIKEDIIKEEIKTKEVINVKEEMKFNEEVKIKEEMKLNEKIKVKAEMNVKGEIGSKEEMKMKGKLKAKEEAKLKVDIKTKEKLKAKEEMKIKEEIKTKDKLKEKEEMKLNGEMKVNTKIKEVNEFNGKMQLNNLTEENYENAKKINAKLKNSNFTDSKEFHSLSTKLKNSNFWQLMTVRTYRNAMLIVICVAAQEHFAGSSVIKLFTQQIFKNTKSTMSLEEESLLLGFLKLIASLIGINIIEKFPRKSLLLYTGLFGTLGLILAGTIFFLESCKIDVSTFTWLPIFGILLYDFMFTIGITNFFYIYLGELFVGEIKSVAITVCKMICLIFVFINILLFQELNKFLGIHLIFAIYAINSILLLSILLKITPETRGRSLNEIQILLKKKKLF